MLLRRLVVPGSMAALILLGAISYCPVPVLAGFDPPNQAELKMTGEPLAPGAPAIFLYRQIDRDDNGLTSHEDNYVRIKIFTEEGRKYANVEIPFVRGSYDISRIRARSIRPDGSIAEFDGKVFEKPIVKGHGMKYLAKTFTLPDAQVGGIIEYFYTIDYKEHWFYESHWILNDELFTRSVHFSLKPYRRDNFGARWSWQNLPAGVSPPVVGQRGIVTMEASNIPAFQTEDHMPPADEMKARVDFVYEDSLPFKDVNEYWKRVGKERNGKLESFVGKKKAMEDAVAQIVSPTDAPEVKLRKIYDRVQGIRNTSYEIRKTEQEENRDKEKIPANVEEVWKWGYGNGNQLTWLFLGLARAAGFEAYGCWVSERRRYFFTPATTQSGKLDSNVVLVKLNGKDLYFDPGAQFTPYGFLTWYETGVQGLRLDKDGGTWIQTTLPPSSDSRIEHQAKLKLSETGDLEGTLTVTYTGLEAMYKRLEALHEDDVARKKLLEDRIKGQIPAALEVELTNQPDWTSSEAPLVASFDLKIPGWASGAGKRVLVPAGVFTEVEKHLFEHADRVHPIYFEYPYQKVDDVTIELPSGWQVSSVPAEQKKDKGVVGYSLKVEGAKDTLHLTRQLKVDFMILDTKYYAALRAFFQGVRSADEQQIVLQPGRATASN